MATIKVQFNDDIRRITVEQDQLTFKKLRKVIQKKYQNLPIDFVLKYQDEEGDLETVASNPDLQEALSQTPPGKLLRFLIQTRLNNNPIAQAIPQISDFLANAFASISVSKNDQPNTNIPSVKQEPDCPVMELDVPFEEGYRFLNSQAIIFLNRKEYETAEQLLKQIIDLVPNAPVPHYNLACAYSLMNNVDGAIQSLEKAIENGYSNIVHLNSDVDFDNIRNDFRFVAILQRLAPKQFEETVPLEIPEEKLIVAQVSQPIVVPVVEEPKEIVVLEPLVPEVPKQSEEEVPKEIEVKEVPKEDAFGMQASQIIVSEPTEFERALDQLIDMGFTDHQQNVQLLLQHNLDLLATVRSLLGM